MGRSHNHETYLPRKPTVHTKKKEAQAAFKKPKHHVGKRKPPPSNRTVISFKTRAINMPSQNLGEKTEEVNQRNQTLRGLLAKFKHYNPAVRKEGLNGLKLLLVEHTKLAHQQLGLILDSLLPLSHDDDHSVREGSAKFLAFLLSQVDEASIGSFFPLIATYTSSAMTHIQMEVRLDALQYINIIAAYPTLFDSHMPEFFFNFIEMLGGKAVTSEAMTADGPVPGSAMTLRAASAKSRASLLSSLHALVRAQVNLINSKKKESEQIAAQFSELAWTKKDITVFPLQIPGNHHPVRISDIVGNDISRAENAKSESRSIETIAKFVIPLMFSCWVELNPGEMVHENIEPLRKIAEIIDALFIIIKEKRSQKNEAPQSEKNHWMSDYLDDFDRFIFGYFPIKPRVEGEDASGYIFLNLAVGKLVSHFLDELKAMPKKFRMNLSEWIVSSLTQTDASLTFEDKRLAEFLPVLKSLLHHPSHLYFGGLITAFTKFYGKLGSSVPKKNAIQFMLKHLILEYNSLIPKEVTSYWLQSIPKLLYQLASSHPLLTKEVLETLVWFGKRIPKHEQILQSSFNNVQIGLTAFFFTIVDGIGPLFGPFIKLPSDVQAMAIDVLYYFDDLSIGMLRALSSVATSLKVDKSIVQAIFSLVHYRYSRKSMPLGDFLGFLMTCLLLTTTNSASSASSRRSSSQDASSTPSASASSTASAPLSSATLASSTSSQQAPIDVDELPNTITSTTTEANDVVTIKQEQNNAADGDHEMHDADNDEMAAMIQSRKEQDIYEAIFSNIQVTRDDTFSTLTPQLLELFGENLNEKTIRVLLGLILAMVRSHVARHHHRTSNVTNDWLNVPAELRSILPQKILQVLKTGIDSSQKLDLKYVDRLFKFMPTLFQAFLDHITAQLDDVNMTSSTFESILMVIIELLQLSSFNALFRRYEKNFVGMHRKLNEVGKRIEQDKSTLYRNFCTHSAVLFPQLRV